MENNFINQFEGFDLDEVIKGPFPVGSHKATLVSAVPEILDTPKNEKTNGRPVIRCHFENSNYMNDQVLIFGSNKDTRNTFIASEFMQYFFQPLLAQLNLKKPKLSELIAAAIGKEFKITVEHNEEVNKDNLRIG